MTKELEALNYVWYNYYTEELSRNEVEQIEKHLNIVQDGLKRLEAIDNAKPSEALKETLKDIAIDLEYDDNPALRDRYYGLLNLKQALLKAQEQEKVLEIIKKKCSSGNSNLWLVSCLPNYERYIEYRNEHNELTEEEFDLVKRWLDD